MRSPAENTTQSWPALAPTTSSLAPANSPVEKCPTVFVVDDDVNIRDALCLLLQSAGIHAESYGSAQMFLDAYDPARPGCLLLDVGMPGMNGIELQQRLASRKLGPAIIFLTGNGDVPTALQAVRTGAIDYLQKPFSLPVLLDRVREAIVRDARNRREHSECQELESRRARLTAREREVMGLVAAGQNTKEIAARLGISTKTVDTHRVRVLEKMQVDNPVALTHLLLSGELH